MRVLITIHQKHPRTAPGGVAGEDHAPCRVKSVLLVFSAALGTFLILVYFRGVHDRFIREGALLGGVWLLINWALDALVLLPLSGMDAGTYMAQIGLRYLTIPIIAVGIGYAIEEAVRGATVRSAMVR